MPRRKEEPEWDTDEDGASSNGDESGFEDENSEESGSRSDGSSESGSEEGSESGSEEGSESGSEEGSESGSEEDSESGSDSEESGSDESNEDEESLEDIGFNDEEKGRSAGDLMNDPSEDPAWTKLVPAKILAIGISAAAMFCCCLIFIPILAITIGIAVGVGKGAKEVKAIDVAPIDVAPITTTAPTVSITNPPTSSPTFAPVVKGKLLRAVASNTIYLDGANAEETSGQEDIMLVQNGFSNDELPSAYSLVQFDDIIGVDSGMSVDDYLDTIDDLVVDFCLIVASNEREDTATYTTCLLPEVAEGIETLTGSAGYTIPESCLNQKVVTFEVNPFDVEVCVDIASLLTDSTDMSEVDTTEVNTTEVVNNNESSDPTPSLRSRRRTMETEVNLTYLLMIDSLEESDQPGNRFYSSNNLIGAGPTLGIVGSNTCVPAGEAICKTPGLEMLCRFLNEANLTEALNSRDTFEAYTVFAPSNQAFDNLDSSIFESLQDVEALTNVLLYHVAPKEIIKSTDNDFCGASVEMANGGQSTTLCDFLGVYQVGSGASPGVKLPQFIAGDADVCYGVIHFIDEVLIPADTVNPFVSCPPDNEAIDIADLCSQSNSSTFCDLLEKTGLPDVFSGGLYTIFAPTDEAFAAAILALDGSVDFEDQNVVRSIMLQHVIAGSLVYSQDLNCDMEPVQMANGQYNEISCGKEDGDESEDAFFVSGAKISDADTIGCNFVLHSIDGVIIPDLTVSSVVDENMVDFLSGDNSTYSSLVSLVERAGLLELLAIASGITLFAPTNEAFSELSQNANELFTSLQSDDQYLAHLVSLLQYHALPFEIPSYEINPDYTFETLNGELLAFSDLSITGGEVQVQNGIVHTIESVLTPSWVDKSIVDVITGLSDVALVYDLINDANLAEALSGPGPFTVFLPIDSAFDGQFDDVKDLDSDSLASILQNHIVPGIYTGDSISDGLELETLEGEDILFQMIAGTTTVGGQKIQSTDILANNGIIHLIEGLIPGPSEESGDEEPLNSGDSSPSEDVIPESAMTPPPTDE